MTEAVVAFLFGAIVICTRVRNQFMKMRDETNHKNRNEVYFEVSYGFAVRIARKVEQRIIVDGNKRVPGRSLVSGSLQWVGLLDPHRQQHILT